MLIVTEMIVQGHIQCAGEDTHAKQTYLSGGLAPWQKRRALDLMHRHLRGELRLATMAQECRLSSSHFARSFKQSFGTTVHQYLLLQRVEAAKVLLATSAECLTNVALESGFSDQAAFNRTFKANTGTTPGQWRRAAALHLATLAVASSTQAA